MACKRGCNLVHQPIRIRKRVESNLADCRSFPLFNSDAFDDADSFSEPLNEIAILRWIIEGMRIETDHVNTPVAGISFQEWRTGAAGNNKD